MMTWGRRWLPLPAFAAWLWLAPPALAAEEAAQTFKLELKKLVDGGFGRTADTKATPADVVREWSSPQRIVSTDRGRVVGGEGKTFKALAKKEPKYVSAFVIRGVVQLGKDAFPFACDATDLKKGFDKLYFDVNRNGDLTDDPVVQAERIDPSNISPNSDYVPQRSFPRVGVKIRVASGELDYAFFATARAYQITESDQNGSRKAWHGYATFSPGVYREGEVTLAGKKHRICVLDYNSNGLFNDTTSVGDKEHEALANAVEGDMLLVDPDPKEPSIANGGDIIDRVERRHVSKLVWIDNRFWELQVAPAGDSATLTPSSLPTGKVSNPARRFHAVVFGEHGFLAVHGGKDAPVTLPEGHWQLLNYTIDVPEPKKPAKAPVKGKSALGSMIGAITGANRSQSTYASATATWDYKPVTVTKDKTTPLPFGPPYSPRVTVGYLAGKETAHLQMDIVGSAGEECTDLAVKGDRPENPAFSIATATGEIVERGKFEFG